MKETENAPKHTPEPWSVQAGTKKWEISGKGWVRLAKVVKRMKHSQSDSEEGAANARRIVACVNACAGMDTEQLEFFGPGYVKTQADVIAYLREENKQLATALADAMKALIQQSEK